MIIAPTMVRGNQRGSRAETVPNISRMFRANRIGSIPWSDQGLLLSLWPRPRNVSMYRGLAGSGSIPSRTRLTN